MSFMNLVIIGHSFVRRCRDDKVPVKGWRKGKLITLPTDISMLNTRRAAAYAHALRVDNTFGAVYTESSGLNLVDQLVQASNLITSTRPSAAILDIGSNDIAHVTTFDPNAMLELAVKVHNFASSMAPNLVIVHAVLPRTKLSWCSAEIFRKNAAQYNQCLRTLCEGTTDKALVFNGMRGFWHEETDADGKSHPKLVNTWSDDGIHADTPNGMTAYQKRMRLCLLDNMHRVNGTAAKPRRLKNKRKNNKATPY